MPVDLKGKISVDTNDLDRASNAARAFEGHIKDAFKRTGDVRAGAAIENFVQNLTSGNVPGAIEAIAQRLTGLGLAGGVAFGLLAVGFQKGQEELGKLNAAMGAVNMDQFNTGIEGVKKTMTDLAPIADTVNHPLSHALTLIAASDSALKNMIATQQLGVAEMTTGLNQELAKRKEISEEAQLTAAGATDELAKSKDLRTESEAIKQSKKDEAALHEKIDQIAKPGSDESTRLLRATQRLGEGSRDEAAKTLESQTTAIDRQKALRDEAAKSEREAIAIRALGLSQDQEKVALDQAHLASLQRELIIMSDMSDQAKQQKELEVDKAKAGLEIEGKKEQFKRFEPMFEKAQLSFQELLTGPRGSTVSGGSQTLRDAQLQAARAQRELILAEQDRKKGHIMESFEHLNRAQNIKDSIGILKEPEKSPEYAFKSAIDSATVFQTMVQHLQKIREGLPLNLNNM